MFPIPRDSYPTSSFPPSHQNSPKDYQHIYIFASLAVYQENHLSVNFLSKLLELSLSLYDPGLRIPVLLPGYLEPS